jgi:hypothetical protein
VITWVLLVPERGTAEESYRHEAIPMVVGHFLNLRKCRGLAEDGKLLARK